MRNAMRGRTAVLGLVTATAMLLGGCATAPSPSAMDLGKGGAYDLSNYERVMIDPVEVSLDEKWEPTQVGSHLSIGPQDVERFTRDVADMFDASFRAELASGGGVEIVEQAGPGVLRITPVLQDLYLSSPMPIAQPGVTYVRNVGHATLHVVFRDAATGEQVLELHDRVRGRDIGLLRTASPVYNEQELTRIFQDWAQVIRQDLFRAP